MVHLGVCVLRNGRRGDVQEVSPCLELYLLHQGLVCLDRLPHGCGAFLAAARARGSCGMDRKNILAFTWGSTELGSLDY